MGAETPILDTSVFIRIVILPNRNEESIQC
jgi:hypothetical protein